MFGSKSKIPAGARDKIEQAKKMKDQGYFADRRSEGGGDVRYPSQTVPVAIIFALSVILGFLLTGNSSNPLTGMHITGLPNVDSFITGSDITSFTSDPDQNKVITIFLRGGAFFALAGLVPLIAFVFERLFFHKRILPLVICWAVTLILMIMYLFVPANSIGPFLKGILPFLKSL